LEIRFQKRQISFLVVKTVKFKRGISENREYCVSFIHERV